MSNVIHICACCKGPAYDISARFDFDLQAEVCAPCFDDLKNAADAMRTEFIQSTGSQTIPLIYNGPFHGSSNG